MQGTLSERFGVRYFPWTSIPYFRRSVNSVVYVIVGVLDQMIVQVRKKDILCYKPFDWSIKKSFLGGTKKKNHILTYF